MKIEDKAYFAMEPNLQGMKKVRDEIYALAQTHLRLSEKSTDSQKQNYEYRIAAGLSSFVSRAPYAAEIGMEFKGSAYWNKKAIQLAKEGAALGVIADKLIAEALSIYNSHSKPVEDKAYFEKRIEVETWKSPKGTTYIAGLNQGSSGLFQPFITATYSDGGQQLMTGNPPKFKTEGGARKWLSAEITRRKTPNARQGSKAKFAKEYILWALPKGETDRLHERPIAEGLYTPAQVDDVKRKATAAGWHSFRVAAMMGFDDMTNAFKGKGIKKGNSRAGTKTKFANFKVGQIVKYKNPNSDEDPNQKYIIKEVNGDRGFMETHGGYFKDSRFPPRMLYQQNEIMLASRAGTKTKFDKEWTEAGFSASFFIKKLQGMMAVYQGENDNEYRNKIIGYAKTLANHPDFVFNGVSSQALAKKAFTLVKFKYARVGTKQKFAKKQVLWGTPKGGTESKPIMHGSFGEKEWNKVLELAKKDGWTSLKFVPHNSMPDSWTGKGQIKNASQGSKAKFYLDPSNIPLILKQEENENRKVLQLVKQKQASGKKSDLMDATNLAHGMAYSNATANAIQDLRKISKSKNPADKQAAQQALSKIEAIESFWQAKHTELQNQYRAAHSRQGSKAMFEHNLTRKISLQESNSPTQVYKITEELYNKAALLKNKSLGYFELRTLIEKALATGEAVKMSRQGFKSKFAATKIWPNDYSEILNANAKYARLIFDRQKIIRANAGRRIKGEQPLEVPSPPTAPEFPFAFADGDYVGLVLGGQANVPKGATVKWAHNANSIKMSRTGTKVKFANRGAFAEASSSPVLGSLLEKKVMPEGGWRAVETDGGALVIAFEDSDIAGNFARRASENGYSATAPMAMAGRFWNVKVQNENKN